MTPLQMVREYHETAGLDLDLSVPKTSSLEDFEPWYDEVGKEYAKKVVSAGRLREELIKEEVEEVLGVSDKFEYLLKELADLVYVTYGYAATFGMDLDEALKRVHENNMGRMYQDDGTIKRREDGKIIKNPSYPKVDLSDLV